MSEAGLPTWAEELAAAQAEQAWATQELAEANWWRLIRHILRVRQLRHLWGALGGVLRRYRELPSTLNR